MNDSPTPDDLADCETLWAFNSVRKPVREPNLILVMGSNDLSVAHHAAEVASRLTAPTIVCSGGIAHASDLLRTSWRVSEAEAFAEAIVEQGIDRRRILLERKSSNTAENVMFSKKLAEKHGLEVDRALIVHKPFMSLRSWLTAARNWPAVEFGVTHEEIGFAAYYERYGSVHLIDILVGDTKRILSYPALGFFEAVTVPTKVRSALQRLVRRGYVRHFPSA